jgi:hypothetical protein
MVRPLGWIAIGGLSAGVVSLSIAYALGDRSMHRLTNPVAYLTSSCGGTAAAGGAQSERRLAWSGGDTIEIALPATVRYRGGDGAEVIVRGPSDVIAQVAIDGSRLTLDCRIQARLREVEVILPGQKFRRIGLSGSGKLVMENVNQPELAVRISGSGDISAQGKVDHAAVTITGAGRARLADLAMQQLTVKVSGSGNIEAAPTESADIDLSGSGNVRLLTHPTQLRSHVSGSGRITQTPFEAADRKK